MPSRTIRRLRRPSLALAALLAGAGLPARAEEPAAAPAQAAPPEAPASQEASQAPVLPPPEGEVIVSDTTVVTATRLPTDIATVPGSVTVVTREQLEAVGQSSNRSLADALGKVVPGLGLGSQSTSTFGQTLRGRNVLVLVDGVPQSSARNVQHDLRGIDMSAVERVEVVRGTSAIYGEGAAGGIINIITRRPGSGRPRLSTTVTLGTAPVASLDALGGSLVQTASGAVGQLDYALSASLERSGSFFDAQGDRIPADPHGQGGLADTSVYNVFGKVGWSFTDTQRLSFSANHFHGFQATQYTSDPSVEDSAPLTQKSRAIPGLQLQDPQGTRNSVLNLAWDDDDLFGSTLHAQAYYRNHLTRFFPFDGRKHPLYNSFIQSRLETQKGGGRVEIGTPLPFGLGLLWGADGAMEHTAQPVSLIDGAVFDASGGSTFRTVGDATWVPPMDVSTLAAFAQLEWKPLQWVVLRGGARAEYIQLGVPDYTTLVGNPVQGANLPFARLLSNAGIVVTVAEPISTFFNFSQGYSLPDVGLILRNAAPVRADPLDPNSALVPPSVAKLNTAPQRVDMFEVGVRGNWKPVQASLAAYYNASKLGASSGGLDKPVVRAPERVYGMEATVDVTPAEAWKVGGTFTWLEGQHEVDGQWRFLNSYRIPPLKATASLEHQTLPGWRNALLVVYSGARNRFKSAPYGFGERPLTPYATVDLMSSLEAGPGTLQLGVSNLLNAQYYPRESQLLRSGDNTSYAAARGAVANVSYTLSY